MSANANIRAGRAYVEVTAETSKLRANLNAAQAQLKDFGKSCQGLGRDMMALGGALSLPFVLAEKSFAGFDDKMRLVQAVTSATGEQFDELTRTAQRLGRETSFTAQQVADAMIGLGRMGFNPSEITSAIDSVLNLSRATGTDLSESADIAANSLRIFGMEAGKMSKVADILTATANGSAQTLTDLFEGLKMAGPQAAAAGENLNELCASLGVMANMGIKGSLAGTALRKAYVQFADTKIQAILREGGVEATDSSGNLRKMAAVMRDVAAATAKMPTAERLSFMKDVFDVRGMMSGLSLAGNIEDLDKFLARLRDVSGQANETARAMDKGIGGSFRLFQSAVEGTMNAVGEALTETLKPMTDRITAVINEFTKWVIANKGVVTAIAATVASVGTLGAALFAVGTAARVLSSGFGALSGVLSGISSVFGVLCSRGVLVEGAFSKMAEAYRAYHNASLPALVGTTKLLSALNLPIDGRARQIASSLVMMSNAEAAAFAKSAVTSRMAAMAAALKNVNAATIAATVSAKAHSLAVAKEVVVAGFGRMAQAIGSVATATATAAVAAKAHAAALAREAFAGKFSAMADAIQRVWRGTVAAAAAARAHAVAVTAAATAGRFSGLIAALKQINAATVAATVAAKAHAFAVAKEAVVGGFARMASAISAVATATLGAAVAAKSHAAAVAKEAVAGGFSSMASAIRSVWQATVAATVSAKAHAVALASAASAARFSGLIASLKGINAATVAATVSAKAHSLAVSKEVVVSGFTRMAAAIAGVASATACAAAAATAHAAAVAREAVAGRFSAMVESLNGVWRATVAASVAARAHTAALVATATAGRFGGLIEALKTVSLSTVAATVAAKAHALAIAKEAVADRFAAMAAALKGVSVATLSAAVAAKALALAVAKETVADGFASMAAAIRNVASATATATAASLAHAAAVAREAAAGKFNALIASLRGLNRATIAAAVSAKAHAAAETVATIAAKAATAAHTAFVAVTGALSASHAKAAVAAGAAGAANVALALTAKAVAGGYLAASAAAAAFCAIPITWVLIAVVGALAGLCAYMASATKHTAQLSDEMSKLRERGDQLRATDQLRMERLQQLAEKEKLSNAEMQEAEKLSGQLKGRYGNLGVSVDRAAGCIRLAADAQERFNAAMKAQALQQVENEMRELQKNIRELGEENESLTGFWVNAWNTITFRMGKAAKDIEANGEKIDEAMSKLADARKRQQAILNGDEGSLTGGKSEKEELETKVQKGREEKGASQSEAEKAAKRVAEIERKLTREQQTELQNEIADIIELRDEYKRLLSTILSYEKSKKDRDNEKIADLEGRLAEADAAAEKRIATAQAKAKKKFDAEIKDLQVSFDESAEDIARNRSEGETDRKVEDALKKDAAAGMKLLADLINQSKIAAAQAKAEFAKAMQEASADGDISDEEKDRIRKAQEAYTLAEGLVDKYAGKLRSAQDETQKRAGAVKPQGAFYARAASALRGNQMEQRMYQATQEIERHTKKTAELMKDMKGGGTQTFQ